jgi:hypothetical protein
MITTNEEFEKLTGKKPAKQASPNADLVTAIGMLVEAVRNQKAPEVTVSAPAVNVPAPVVNIPKFDPPISGGQNRDMNADKKWVFHVERDADGRLSKIIATPE